MTHSFICWIDTIRWVTVSGIWFDWLIFYIFFLRGWGQVYLSLDWLTKILKKIIWWIDRSLHLLLKRLSFLWNYSLQTGRKDQVVSHCKDLFSVQSNNTRFPFPDTPLTKLASQGTAAAGKAMVPEDLHQFLWFWLFTDLRVVFIAHILSDKWNSCKACVLYIDCKFKSYSGSSVGDPEQFALQAAALCRHVSFFRSPIRKEK